MKSKKPADASAKNKLPSSSDSLPEDFLADDAFASPPEAAPLEDDFAALDFGETASDEVSFGEPIAFEGATAEEESIAFGDPIAEEESVDSLAFDEPRALSEPSAEVASAEVAPVAVAAAVPVAPVTAVTALPIKSGGGKGRILAVALASFLVVGAMTLAAASTMVALKQIKLHDEASAALVGTTQAMDQFVAATMRHSKLKGPANAKTREEILTPAIQAYQKLLPKLTEKKELLPELASAQFHLAALSAKTGSSDCSSFLDSGVNSLKAMKEQHFPPERFPSLHESCLSLTTPLEWGLVKTENRELYAMGLLVAFNSSLGTLGELAKEYPQATVFRSDLSSLQRTSAILQTAAPGRRTFALNAWIEARDLLEGLVKQEPANVDFQTRLAEALIGAARLQKEKKEIAEATANFQRAVEVREQLAAAGPDDKALKDDVASVKRELASMPAVSASAAETPAPAEETATE